MGRTDIKLFSTVMAYLILSGERSDIPTFLRTKSNISLRYITLIFFSTSLAFEDFPSTVFLITFAGAVYIFMSWLFIKFVPTIFAYSRDAFFSIFSKALWRTKYSFLSRSCEYPRTDNTKFSIDFSGSFTKSTTLNRTIFWSAFYAVIPFKSLSALWTNNLHLWHKKLLPTQDIRRLFSMGKTRCRLRVFQYGS